MRKHVDFRFRKLAAIDDAGVIESVRNDVILRREDRRHSARIGGKSGLKNHASFRILELRDPPFQLHMNAHGSGDGPHRARARAIFLGGIHRSLDQLRVIRQSEVVVAGKIDYFTSVKTRDWLASRFEHAQALKCACLMPCLNLFA